MKKTLALLFFLMSLQFAFAQSDWQNQDNTYFIYAEGNSQYFKNEKFLFVSSNMITFKMDREVYPETLRVRLSLAFSEALDKIKVDESVSGVASYYSIHIASPKINSLTGNSGAHNIHYSERSAYDIKEADSKIFAAEKIRAGIITDYQSRGYKVYQVYFNPMNYKSLQGENARLTDGSALIYQPRSKLSELWIPAYTRGVINRRISNLISEEENKRKASTSSSTSSDETKAIRYIQQTRASELEAEGDRLYAMGSLYYAEAMKKYQLAYDLYPTASTEKKLKDHEALMMTMEGLSKLGDGIEKGVENLDPKGRTQFTNAFLAYNGLLTGKSHLPNIDLQSPKSILFGITGHRIFITWEILRMGYMESPVFSYPIWERSSSYKYDVATKDTLMASVAGASIGMSGGFNVPFKSFLLYGMYGYDFGGDLIIGKTKIRSQGYSMGADEKKLGLGLLSQNWTFGFNYKLPKSKFSIGLTYTMQTIKGKYTDVEFVRIKNDNDINSNSTFFVKESTLDRYKYNYFGIRLMELL